jgi:putative peptide zinc metalloprotease protein
MALLPKLRTDLVSSSSIVDGATVHTVKDPVGGNYFRLREPEFWLIGQFDGHSTPDQIAERFRKKYNLNISAADVGQFIATMDKLLFLENSRAEQTTGRFSSGLHTGRSLVGRMLFVRLKAFKPGRFLDTLTSLYRPFHKPIWFVIEALIILGGLTILFQNADQFAVSLVELWSLESLGLLVGSIFLLLTLHEFAHAVLCRLYGGEVREIGFLLLYFQPCFYCDLSDAWLFEKKSQRMAVSWAGPYFQLLLLALSVLVWRVTVPESWLNHWAWILVTVNWINLLFNFNPLIKLDGYYLLSDWLDIPNLRQKAFAYLGNFLQRRLLGWNIDSLAATPRQRRIFVIYGLTALVYTVSLLGYIGWLLGSLVLSKAGSGGLVLLIIALLVILRPTLGKLASGIVAHIRHMRQLLKKPLKLASYLIIFAVVFTAGLVVPMSQRVSGDILVRPVAEFSVSLTELGLLEKTVRFGGEQPGTGTDMGALSVWPCVKDGQLVAVGDTVAIMSSNQIKREIETGRAELERLNGKLALLKSPPKQEEVNEANAQVKASQARVDQLIRDRDLMKALVESNAEAKERLIASQSELDIAQAELLKGLSTVRLLQAPPKPEEEAVIRHEISKQEANLTFLAEQEAAGFITTPVRGIARIGGGGRQVVSVADAETVELLVPVSDFDMPLIKLGQIVLLKVRSYPDRVFEGRVIRVPKAGDLVGETVSFPVTVVVANNDGLLCDGMSGYAKIETGESSLFGLGFRKLISTLKVEFWSWW